MERIENKETQARLQAIFALDLEPIKGKLMDQEEGPGWSREQADACELEYKRFLAIAASFRGETIVPSVEVDQFWHTHILDTRKYAADCENALGFFLHHTPHYGAREVADAAKMEAAFERSRQMYRQVFGYAGNERSAAWCAVADDKAKQAAWCAVADDKAKKAAWCAVADDKAKKAAWCAVADDKPKKAAWCAVADDKAKKAAWCAVADDKAKEAAWCAVADDKAVAAFKSVKTAQLQA